VNGEPDLVDEVVLEQGSAESTVSVHHEVTAVLLLELRHRGDDVVTDDRGVVPVGALQGRGEHVLADCVDRVRVRPVCWGITSAKYS
jgi:hypothetical protein